MDRYEILARFIFEQENLIEQLVPRKDWTNLKNLKFDPDELVRKVKSGEARKAKFKSEPKLDPSKGSTPNLPAVVKPKFLYSGDSAPFYKSKTAKIIGATVLAAAIAAIGYKIYKKYYKKENCEKIENKQQREICLKKQKVIALSAQKKALENMKKQCVKSSNPSSCQRNIDVKIKDLDSKIKAA